MHTHLIFDLGGTLIFDPFEQTLQRMAVGQYRQKVEAGLSSNAVDEFFNLWREENHNFNFPFASHFFQEEPWITRAAWPSYDRNEVVDKRTFPLWVTDVLATYRTLAMDVIASQPQLPSVREALQEAKTRGYRLSVASNDRYFATSAMLAAADLLRYFDFVATSEGLSFSVPGAEKPSKLFFEALQARANLQFESTNTLYIGDDESRDIKSTRGLPIRRIRFFGNKSASKSWLDNEATTEADFHFATYAELRDMITAGALEKR